MEAPLFHLRFRASLCGDEWGMYGLCTEGCRGWIACRVYGLGSERLHTLYGFCLNLLYFESLYLASFCKTGPL